MELELEKDNIFIPTFNENLTQPEEQRVKIHWRHPTAKEKTKMKHFSDPVVEKGGMKDELKIIVDYDLMLEKLVFKIDNLKVGGVKVEDGVGLNNTQLMGELKDEITTMLLQQMDVIDAKKNSSKSQPT